MFYIRKLSFAATQNTTNHDFAVSKSPKVKSNGAGETSIYFLLIFSGNTSLNWAPNFIMVLQGI